MPRLLGMDLLEASIRVPVDRGRWKNFTCFFQHGVIGRGLYGRGSGCKIYIYPGDVWWTTDLLVFDDHSSRQPFDLAAVLER
jgi:hypothetical protein